MKRWASPLIRICVFLLLGAIVNVAVAWGCIDSHMRTLIAVQNDVWPMSYRNSYAPGHAGPSITWVVPADNELRSVSIGHHARLDQRFIESRFTDTSNPADATDCRIAVGWPLLAMQSSWQPRRAMSLSAFTLHARNDWWLIKRIALPKWPGFAINTIFYAAILWGGWLLFAAPFALRRRIRIKRGLCPACGYPVGGSDVCTECGAAVPLSLAAVGGPRERGQG